MITVIQRVSFAEVKVDGQLIGSISKGILALVGFEKTDSQETIQKWLTRLLNYRIFSDESGKMNLNVKEIQGGLLLVPQFTLVADTQSGLRPSFSRGADPLLGKKLFDELSSLAKTQHNPVAFGQFGAHMEVKLCNDGPVTFIL